MKRVKLQNANNESKRVRCSVTGSQTATLLQVPRNEVSGRNQCAVAIQQWTKPAFLSCGPDSDGVWMELDSDMMKDSTAFTVEIHEKDTRYARIRDIQGRFMCVDVDSHQVRFCEHLPNGDETCGLWKLQCVGRKSPQGMVGANLLESVRCPMMYLKITRE